MLTVTHCVFLAKMLTRGLIAGRAVAVAFISQHREEMAQPVHRAVTAADAEQVETVVDEDQMYTLRMRIVVLKIQYRLEYATMRIRMENGEPEAQAKGEEAMGLINKEHEACMANRTSWRARYGKPDLKLTMTYRACVWSNMSDDVFEYIFRTMPAEERRRYLHGDVECRCREAGGKHFTGDCALHCTRFAAE